MNVPELVQRAAELMRSVDEFGPLHIIVADGNIEDCHIEMCEAKTADEKELLTLLRGMTADARENLWENTMLARK